MEDKVDEYAEDVMAEMNQISEMEKLDQKHDEFSSSKSCTHGKAEVGGTEVVNCNGKEALTLSLGVIDEKKHVPELLGAKSVQDREEDEKLVPFSEARPEIMQAYGPHGAKNQLTIFYGGEVCVFDSIPAEKVREILLLATAGSTKPAKMNDIGTQAPLSSVTTTSPSPQTAAQDSSLRRLKEIPIARRHSLQRFLEKRRDRLATKSPYPYPSTKTDDNLEKIHGDKNSSDSVNIKQTEEEFRPAIVAS